MIIYKVTNTINNICYIGKTIFSLNERIKEHIHQAKKNKLYFHRALNKYGFDNFDWEKIEDCNDFKQLNKREIYWIKKLNTKVPSGYNLTDGGEGSLGYEKSIETREKLSKSLKGYPAWNKGKRYSIDVRKKMSENHWSKREHSPWNKGKKGLVIVTEETRKKLSLLWIGRKHSEETKEKLRKIMTGREYKDEWRKKISENHADVSGKKNPNWNGGKIRKNCLNCGKFFYVIRSKINRSKNCSKKCKYLAFQR